MKTAVVYQFYAHYRGPIINSLLEDKTIDYVFIGGEELPPSLSSIKSYQFSQSLNYFKVRNYWFKSVFLWQSGLINHLMKSNYDSVVFLGDWKYMSTWFAVILLRFKRTKTYFWSHGILNNKKNINERIKLLFLKQFSHGGFVYNHRAKSIMESQGFSKPLHVVYNSLDFIENQRILTSIENKDILKPDVIGSVPYLVFVGRVNLQRELELAVDALKNLKDKGITIDLIIIGDGDHLEKLKSYSNSIGLKSQIKYLGAIYDNKLIGNILYYSLGCVFPGPIGLSVIHAMSFKTIVITNDNSETQKPEFEALINGVNGFTFQEGNVHSLIEKIETLSQLSPQKREQMRDSAYEVVCVTYNPVNQRNIFNQILLKDNLQ